MKEQIKLDLKGLSPQEKFLKLAEAFAELPPAPPVVKDDPEEYINTLDVKLSIEEVEDTVFEKLEEIAKLEKRIEVLTEELEG